MRAVNLLFKFFASIGARNDLQNRNLLDAKLLNRKMDQAPRAAESGEVAWIQLMSNIRVTAAAVGGGLESLWAGQEGWLGLGGQARGSASAG